MPSAPERLSRTLLRFYPRAWRERYGAEMLALIDESGSTWWHAFDLAVGCADAWLRSPTRAWAAPIVGAVLVRVVTETALHFSLIPPAPVRTALYGAFWLLVACLNGSMLLTGIVALVWGFRRAWSQWFNLVHGRPLLPPSQKDLTKALPSVRQVWTLRAVVVVTAIGADLTRIDPALENAFHLPGLPPTIPWATWFTLLQTDVILWSLSMLAAGPWRYARVRRRKEIR